MAKNTTYVARWNGEIVGTRKSPRPYTHAIVVQYDYEGALAAGKAWQPDAVEHSNWGYYQQIAAGNDPHAAYRTSEELERIKATVAAGWDAYVEAERERRLKYVLTAKREPYVAGWSQSAHNAQKLAAEKARFWHTKLLGIVPAEVK